MIIITKENYNLIQKFAMQYATPLTDLTLLDPIRLAVNTKEYQQGCTFFAITYSVPSLTQCGQYDYQLARYKKVVQKSGQVIITYLDGLCSDLDAFRLMINNSMNKT
jgi:hypothetical protein